MRSEALSSSAGGGIALDELEAYVDLELGLFDVGEGGFEIDAALVVVAGLALGDAKERLNLPEVGLGRDDGLKEWERLIVLALEEEEDAEVGADFEVGRVDGQCGLELWNGEVGAILMQVGLRLLEVGGKLLLVGTRFARSRALQTRAEPIPWKDFLALGTYYPDHIESQGKELAGEKERDGEGTRRLSGGSDDQCTLEREASP